MRIGFTGSRNGMNNEQRELVIQFLEKNKDIEFEVHHGDCIGADTDFHNICSKYDKCKIYIHPPNNNTMRSFCISRHILEPKPYIIRNHNIVNSCDILLACPSGKTEQLRSGTWATIRYARKINKSVLIY